MRSETAPTAIPEPGGPAPILERRRASPETGGFPVGLRKRFSQFRRENVGGTRIPDELRQAVLEALEGGASISTLRRELGLTASQVADWKRHRPATPAKPVPPAPVQPARVFGLTQASCNGEQASVPGGGPESLELRLGAWSIVIRPSCP